MTVLENGESPSTVEVWVWLGRYEILHAGWDKRAGATLLNVPLPRDAKWLRQIYGHVTGMTVASKEAKKPIYVNRPCVVVRVWLDELGNPQATFAKRKDSRTISLALPAELEDLIRWHTLLRAAMLSWGVPMEPLPRRTRTRYVPPVVVGERYSESTADSRYREVSAGLPTLGRKR
ncbi:hypothetical protein ACIRD3_15660 [Kitasatospora sp. NPDC093550]|uniref:hypothetical protein n=1 Tax=Kitasatospora sp. NPDC093550 TaxID=3364089 RepID=UPI003823332F